MADTRSSLRSRSGKDLLLLERVLDAEAEGGDMSRKSRHLCACFRYQDRMLFLVYTYTIQERWILPRIWNPDPTALACPVQVLPSPRLSIDLIVLGSMSSGLLCSVVCAVRWRKHRHLGSLYCVDTCCASASSVRSHLELLVRTTDVSTPLTFTAALRSTQYLFEATTVLYSLDSSSSH